MSGDSLTTSDYVLGSTGAHRPSLMGTRHMAVAGHYAAAHAAFAILEAGGNAIDAGVAAGIALGVLQCDLVNVAGVAPIILYHAKTDQVHTISGLGTWPKLTDVDYFRKNHGGKIPPGLRRTIVPAAPEAWITALKRFGTMSFGEAAAAATRFAGDGFPMYPLLAGMIKLMWTAPSSAIGVCKRPGATGAPGLIAGHGHRRPRLYRRAILSLSSPGLKYPGVWGQSPHAFGRFETIDDACGQFVLPSCVT